MIGGLPPGLERALAGPADALRLVALVLLGVAWLMPPMRWLWRRFVPRPLAPWIPMHQCARCGRMNPPDAAQCLQCGNIFARGWERWRRTAWGSRLERGLGVVGRLWGLTGWVVLYAVTVPVALQGRVFSSTVRPWERLFGSLTVILALVSLSFFHQALARGARALTSRFQQLLMGIVLLGFLSLVGFVGTLGAGAGPTVAVLAVASDGAVTALVDDRTAAVAPAARVAAGWSLPIRYGVFSWPLFGVDRRILLRLGARSVADPWDTWAFAGTARLLGGEGAARPHWSVLNQTLTLPPSGRRRLAPGPAGQGLELSEVTP